MIRLSTHAQQQLLRRELALAWIEAAITSPEWTEADTDPGLTRSFKRIDAFGGRVLRVVHRTEGSDILVITSFFDRDARR